MTSTPRPLRPRRWRPSRERVIGLALAVLAWLLLWVVGRAAGLHPRPVGLVAAVALATASAEVAAALLSRVGSIPRVDLRATPGSPVGDDHRLLRHQLHLQDATADPPSCRPVLNQVVELTHERLRLVHGVGSRSIHGAGAAGSGPQGNGDQSNGDQSMGDQSRGIAPGTVPRDLLGPHLAALLTERPPDRTRLSPRELARLVDDLETL